MSDVLLREIVAGYEGSEDVLSGITMTIPHGDLAAILGPSGSGKSTLLRVIAGLVRPRAGAVMLGGRAVSGPRVHVPTEKRRIGLVPQDAALFPHLSVRANVAFGLPRTERNSARVAQMLDLVDMSDFADRSPGELSGGQRHRVALARALAPDPDVVLLDEPFSALDASLRTEIRAHVRRVLRYAGATAILVTHDQDEALSIADQVAVVNNGRLMQVGTPAELYTEPASRWVAQFVGGAIVLAGRWNGKAVECPLGTVPARVHGTETPAKGAAVDVVLRPEQMALHPRGKRAPTGVTALVRDVEYFGHDCLVTLDLPGHPEPVQSRVLGNQQWARDSEVVVTVTSEGIAFT